MVPLAVDGWLHSMKYGVFCKQPPKLFTGLQFLLISLELGGKRQLIDLNVIFMSLSDLYYKTEIIKHRGLKAFPRCEIRKEMKWGRCFVFV